MEEMSRQRIMAFVCHLVACLLFPLATTIGFQVYKALFGATFASGVAIGLAVQLIFIAFVLANGLIALMTNPRAKIALTGALVLANLAYLLPQHPLRALFFASLSGVLTLAAIYAARRLTPDRQEHMHHSSLTATESRIDRVL